jgi:hydroxymethylbilane synthase
MHAPERPIILATRGSELALAQSNFILAQCQAEFSELRFELKIIKTTGDKLQTASLAQEGKALPKGLFTKELELALLDGSADLAVHSLKDLPTELPEGLRLGAVGVRADVRDALIYRKEKFGPGLRVQDLPEGAIVATSSTRRKAQVQDLNASLRVVEIRGNVGTRLEKLAKSSDIDATLLAVAGLERLRINFSAEGALIGQTAPQNLLGSILETDTILPCVGQGALGIEIREKDEQLELICKKLNHLPSAHCVTAERSFLSAMGGGCQSPVAAYAQVRKEHLEMRVLAFANGKVWRAEGSKPAKESFELGQSLAQKILSLSQT